MACEDALQQQMNQHIMQGLGKSSIDTFGVNCTLCVYIFVSLNKRLDQTLQLCGPAWQNFQKG